MAKKHLNFILPVEIDYDVGQLSKVRFKFEQGAVSKIFDYPSEKASRESPDGNVILLRWSNEDTHLFSTNRKIRMDTLPIVEDSGEELETEIVDLVFNPTLFTLEEVEEVR